MQIALLFQGQEIRFTGTSDKPEWVAADVVMVLYPDGEAKNRTTYLRSVPAEWKGLRKVQTLGGEQEMITLFEAGLYWLIARSNSPTAVPFQKWVFEEVLPSIRKTGSYPSRVQYSIPLPKQERSEVSAHLVRVWLTLKESDRWLTNKEIASMAGISVRTARSHTKYLLDLGLLDMIETFPGHRFKLSESAQKRNFAAYQRLEQVTGIMANPFLLSIV